MHSATHTRTIARRPCFPLYTIRQTRRTPSASLSGSSVETVHVCSRGLTLVTQSGYLRPSSDAQWCCTARCCAVVLGAITQTTHDSFMHMDSLQNCAASFYTGDTDGLGSRRMVSGKSGSSVCCLAVARRLPGGCPVECMPSPSFVVVGAVGAVG